MKINNPNRYQERKKLEFIVSIINNIPIHIRKTEFVISFVKQFKKYNSVYKDNAKIITFSNPKTSYLKIVYE